ncbi:unnamed protein product [Rotaria socialis]|uniref:Uncharacterized protein n=1 Tax=Rotaria socialis TaxID=392032 RepID=A0A817ZJ95_9BILA|nr:unnamed protein product [Rotaria socialis]CAF3332765.1 unnamed protein product [Rotaria socialis]CAF3333615.1 unnamed protein product [Rotaria socialis]CAF3395050.1 unnamed protein product [Rotaria socialis]CAF3704851.1 unnamed protein product [Rotaria socialis]
MLSIFLLYSLITITTSITPVPGTIHVQLLPTNQVANEVYRPSTAVHYVVNFENVPINNDVSFGVEIRGSNPRGGPRGYIAMAYSEVPIKEFIARTNNYLEFNLVPAEIFAGYSWFLRPFVFFTNESMGSTNMMNSGASKMFTILKQ